VEAGTAVISTTEARRLALAQAGLLRERPEAGRTRAERRRACHRVLQRLGYLQLDTISVAGARSHTIVLLSRLDGLDAETPEELLAPRQPLFEYWGHEASWLPIDLYPAMAFRRERYALAHPWWGALLREHRRKASAIKKRIQDEGPLRSADFEDNTKRSDWGFTLTKRLLHSLWSAGEIGVRERRNFHRFFDLTERVVPARWRTKSLSLSEGIHALVDRTLRAHGWASTNTLVQNFRLGSHRREVTATLAQLEAEGEVVRCKLRHPSAKSEMTRRSTAQGWIRPQDLELASRLRRRRLRRDRGVLLSPFDLVLWDRDRVRLLFGFDQILEVYKPASQRKYGYFCLPVLAGDSLVARCDLKAHRSRGELEVLSTRFEEKETPTSRAAVRFALERYADGVELRLRR
jgi:uncharacterized protein YcaQ